MWCLHYIIFSLKWSIYSLWVEMVPSLTKTTMQKGPGLDESTYCILSLVRVFHTVMEMPVIFLAIKTNCHPVLEQGNFLVPYLLDISLSPSCKRESGTKGGITSSLEFTCWQFLSHFYQISRIVDLSLSLQYSSHAIGRMVFPKHCLSFFFTKSTVSPNFSSWFLFLYFTQTDVPMFVCVFVVLFCFLFLILLLFLFLNIC